MTDNVDCRYCVDTDDPHVLAHTAAGYVRPAVDDNGQVMPDSYAIIPWDHHVDLSALPLRWWQFLIELFEMIPDWTVETPYNLSVNLGEAAGGADAHHSIVVTRRSDEVNQASYGLGLPELVMLVNQLAVENAQLRVAMVLTPTSRQAWLDETFISVADVRGAALSFLENDGCGDPSRR